MSTVLVVDDDPTIADSVAVRLRARGLRTGFFRAEGLRVRMYRGFAAAARKKSRPMRPKPLIPTFNAMAQLL